MAEPGWGAERAGGPVAVCVLTLERQADYVLITLRSCVDVAAGPQTVRVTRDPQEALAWIRAVIAAHARLPHGP